MYSEELSSHDTDNGWGVYTRELLLNNNHVLNHKFYVQFKK